MNASQQAILRADPGLSRFDPLPRILFYDDFNAGFGGWSALIGNYEDTLDKVLPGFRGMGPPQRSTAPHWDTGSHGAMTGSYALKIATLPKAGALNLALKRITFRRPCPIRMEMYFAFNPEADTLRLLDTDVRSVGVIFDLQDPDGKTGGRRAMPHIKYLNAFQGERTEKWQFKSHVEDDRRVGPTGQTRSHPHFAGAGWRNIPGAGQRLCYNELPTKLNWHYLRIGVDLESMRVTALQCNDRVFETDPVETMVMPAWPNLWCMLNTCLFCETDTDRRAFLYVDSVLLSGDWEDA